MMKKFGWGKVSFHGKALLSVFAGRHINEVKGNIPGSKSK